MDKRTALRNGGAALIPLAIGLYASGWPEHVRAHPYWIGLVCLLGAASFVSSFFFKSPNAQNGIKQSVKTGGDHLGQQVAAGRDVHYHEAARQIPVQHVRLQSKMQQRPNLIGLDPKSVPSSNYSIHGVKGWKPLAILPIENRIGRTITVHKLCASIRFNGSNEHYVKKAYWLGNSGNVTHIPIGEIASVVIGQLVDDRLYYFDNPRAYPEMFGRQYSFDSKPDPDYITIHPDGITAKVILFDPDKGTTLLGAKLSIEASGTIVRLR